MTRNFGNDGSPFSVTKLRTLENAHDKEGVLDGCDGSTGSGSFETDVGSGNVLINGTAVSVASESGLSHSTSGTEDRIDLVTVNSSDTKNVVEGNQASTSGQPNAPDIPTDEVVLYLVEVRGGSSEIKGGDIFNEYKTIVSLPGATDEETALIYNGL